MENAHTIRQKKLKVLLISIFFKLSSGCSFANSKYTMSYISTYFSAAMYIFSKRKKVASDIAH